MLLLYAQHCIFLCGDRAHESLQIEQFVEKDLAIIKWVALGAFIIQVLSVWLACWLTSVQKAELEAAERYGMTRKKNCHAR